MLFSPYVNDLPTHIQDGFISLYAGDTAICISDSGLTHLQAKLNNQLLIVKGWYQRNKLSLNLDKTKVMIFGTTGSIHTMSYVNIDNVERVNSFKYLGVKLDSHLNFYKHVAYIESKTVQNQTPL